MKEDQKDQDIEKEAECDWESFIEEVLRGVDKCKDVK